MRARHCTGAPRHLERAVFAELTKKFDPITTHWTYFRWLGDRKGIEKLTMTWDETVVDRMSEITSWVNFCYQIRKRGVVIYAYANNHYAGHGPSTDFRVLSRGFQWDEQT